MTTNGHFTITSVRSRRTRPSYLGQQRPPTEAGTTLHPVVHYTLQWVSLILTCVIPVLLMLSVVDGRADIPVWQGEWPTLGWSIAYSPDASVVIADVHSDTVIKYDLAGNVLTTWGSEGSGDGQFVTAAGVTVDHEGNVYVSDTYSHRIQNFGSSGHFLTTWGAQGAGPGQLSYPNAMAITAEQTLLVCDRGNNRLQEFTSNGVFLKEIGFGPLLNPMGVCVSRAGNIIVSGRDDRITIFSRGGDLIRSWGSEGAAPGMFSNPVAVAVNEAGTIFVVDRLNHRIQAFDESGQFLYEWGRLGSAVGEFLFPTDIVAIPNGLVLVVDGKNSRIQVFDIETSISITTWSFVKSTRWTR